MARCKKCGKEMDSQRSGFCSLLCYNLDLQEQINSIGKTSTISKRV